ncbi:MAG: helix-turn-helix domain-containing protein [Lachnospiraceae bacterium]
MKLGELINKYRQGHSMSMEAFAERCGLSKGYISMIEKGVNPRSGNVLVPTIETIRKLSVGMQMDFNDVLTLVEGEQEISMEKGLVFTEKQYSLDFIDSTRDIMQELTREMQEKVFNFTKRLHREQTEPNVIPISDYTPVNVINKASAGTGYMYGDNNCTVVYTDKKVNSYDFALFATGNSMQPLISDGDTLLCRKDFDFINGHIYIVDYDGETFVKKVYDIGHQLKLVSENPDYEDKFLNKDECLRVVGSVTDWFEPVLNPLAI